MFTVDFDLSPITDALNSMQPDGAAQIFFTNELMRYSDDYTPSNSTALRTSAMVEKGGTAIIYNTPYARYDWFGKLMVDPVYQKGAFFKEGYGFWSRPNVKKQLTNIDLNFQGAPKRGSHWVYRAFIDNKDRLLEETLKVATRFE